MLANKNWESLAAGDHRRQEEPLQPLSSWALEAVSSLRQEEPR